MCLDFNPSANPSQKLIYFQVEEESDFLFSFSFTGLYIHPPPPSCHERLWTQSICKATLQQPLIPVSIAMIVYTYKSLVIKKDT